MVDQKNVLTKCLHLLEKCPWNGTWVKPFHSVNVHRDIYMWCKHTAEHASSADKHERRWTVGWSKHCLEKLCRVWRGVLPLISAGNSAGKSEHIVTWLRLFVSPKWHYQILNRILRPCVNTRCNMALFGHWSLIVASKILMLWSQPTVPSGKYRTKPQRFAISCKTLNFLVSGRCFSTQLTHTKPSIKKWVCLQLTQRRRWEKKVELGMKTALARKSRICHTWKVPNMFTYYIHTWMQTTLCIWVCLKNRYTSMWISYILLWF